MIWFKQWLRKFGYLNRGGRFDDDLSEEMRLHLDMMVDENIAAGMTKEEARKAASKRFGNVEYFREDCRESWGLRVVESLMRDICLSIRLLKKSKGFTLAVVATLALCIGGNASIFTILNNVLLRPLPFPESERIVTIHNSYPKIGQPNAASNVPMYLDFRDETSAFSGLALVDEFEGNVGGDRYPERVFGFSVTPGFFSTIGVNPLVGTFFSEENSVQGQHRVAVLSHKYWESRYSSDHGIVGQSIRIDEELYEVRGVAPRSLEALYPSAQIYVAYSWNPGSFAPLDRHSNDPQLLGRLKRGVSIEVAKAQVDVRDQAFSDSMPEFRQDLINAGHETIVIGLQERRTTSVRGVLFLLQAGGMFVWLIGCVNVSNLALTRANARQWEFALRTVLGARRLDIGRQLYAESVLLSILGAFVGVALGVLGIGLINRYAMAMLPPMPPLSFDVGSTVFAIGLALLSGLLIATLPAIRLFSRKLVSALGEGARSVSTGRTSNRISSSLVCGQIALALILLVGAGLLTRSFAKLVARDVGIDPENVTTLRIPLTGASYRDNANVVAFKREILESIRALPGIESVGIGTNIPMSSDIDSGVISYTGFEKKPDDMLPVTLNTRVSPGYFETLGIELLKGETFGPFDAAQSRKGVVIDQHLADLYFPGVDPIGKKMISQYGRTDEENWPTIIGIVENAQHERVDEISGSPTAYYSLFDAGQRTFSVFVKSEMDPDQVVSTIRGLVAERDSEIPVFMSGSLSEYLDETLNGRRMVMLLISIAAAIALLLSSIGVYGVTAYGIGSQRKEIGTRLAIGASRGEIVVHFLKRALGKTLVGLALGLVGAVALSRFVESMLYGIEATELSVYLSIAVLLFAVSMLASYLPVLGASRVSPMTALRAE